MEQLLFTVKDHYLALFSPLGQLAKTFPVNISLAETEERSLRISLNITSDYKSYNADTLKALVHAFPDNAASAEYRLCGVSAPLPIPVRIVVDLTF